MSIHYLFWSFKVLLAALRLKSETLLIATSIDNALPIAIASHLNKKIQFMFADLDTAMLSKRWCSGIYAVVERAMRFTAQAADIYVVPSKSRPLATSQNVHILPNTPTSRHISGAVNLASERGYTRLREFTVYVNGWLPETRGARQIAHAIRLTARSQIKWIVAGKSIEQSLRMIASKSPHVTLMGRLSATEAFAQYYRTHLVITLYDPRIPINRLAEPNKWKDCIVTGTPFVVNQEVDTAKNFIENGACIVVPYSDSEALAEAIIDLSTQPERWRAISGALGELTVEPWDTMFMALVSRALGSVGGESP